MDKWRVEYNSGKVITFQADSFEMADKRASRLEEKYGAVVVLEME